MTMRGVLSLALFTAAGASAPSCISDSGADVDFAYAFKYPKGFDYAYMDSSHKLAQSEHTLDTASSSISKTIMQMHDSGVSTVMWNDEPATGQGRDSSAPYAHAKGLLLFTSAGGVWLTHSLPKFPVGGASDVETLWKDGSEDFGQSYLCITVSAAEIRKLSPLFKITRPTVYYTKFASGAESAFPGVMEWTSKKWDEETMTMHVSITSKGGQEFTVYGKAGKWGAPEDGKDLYSDLVAPAEGKLFMEGWRRGAGKWGPACGKDEVLDVMDVSFPGRSWDVMKDHSKWAVTETGKVLCIGDMNRMNGQDKRGGATVCIHDSSIASQIKDVISSTDKCSGDLVLV